MSNHFSHQKTIGIIGATPDALEFIIEANRLGFTTVLFSTSEKNENINYPADHLYIGKTTDMDLMNDFLMDCDLLVYFDYSISSKLLEQAKKTVVIPQGEDLLSIARDKVLQKAFKESLGLHVAPSETIVKPEDLNTGIHKTGYPAFLSPNYSNHENHKKVEFVYDKEDLKRAKQHIKYGTYVLESWITSKYELSISLVKTATGHIKLFPIINQKYQNDRLSYVQTNPDIHEDLKEEIERIAYLLATNIEFQGVISIDFLVSPADTLYVGNITPFPNLRTRYSLDGNMPSIIENHVRAITSLPVLKNDEENQEMQTLFLPIYIDQKEAIDKLLNRYSSWEFIFYPEAKEERLTENDVIGHIQIRTMKIDERLAVLKKYNFIK